jgi:hypothetical protein
MLASVPVFALLIAVMVALWAVGAFKFLFDDEPEE